MDVKQNKQTGLSTCQQKYYKDNKLFYTLDHSLWGQNSHYEYFFIRCVQSLGI